MRRHGLAEILTGAVVLVTAAIFLAYALMHSGRSVGSGYLVKASFGHIDGLAVGSDVRIAGVKVGTVTDERIDPKTFAAIVSMMIRDDIQVPKDTGASITSESLLGGKYISLSPGGDEADLKPGQTISITQSSVSLEELLGKFIFSVTSLNNSKDNKSGGGQQPSSQQPSSQQPGDGGGLPPLSK